MINSIKFKNKKDGEILNVYFLGAGWIHFTSEDKSHRCGDMTTKELSRLYEEMEEFTEMAWQIDQNEGEGMNQHRLEMFFDRILESEDIDFKYDMGAIRFKGADDIRFSINYNWYGIKEGEKLVFYNHTEELFLHSSHYDGTTMIKLGKKKDYKKTENKEEIEVTDWDKYKERSSNHEVRAILCNKKNRKEILNFLDIYSQSIQGQSELSEFHKNEDFYLIDQPGYAPVSFRGVSMFYYYIKTPSIMRAYTVRSFFKKFKFVEED